MKKVLFVFMFALLAIGVQAQQGSKAIMPKLGYQTEFERLGLGVEGRYFLTNNIRIAPGLTFLVPNNNITGLDVDINVHYVFPIEGVQGLALYPFVGGAMLNNRISVSGVSASDTSFGINIGAGGQYDITDNGYLNFEFKYTFVEHQDPAYFMLGYGIRF
ncbi:outer membrane beta-barrel protein [Dysgonomonas mossii]|uniref:Porin family protein n=1 Tax=Dysgonomonas mossii TaxID=163665 RepID=A0A4Y9IPY7_9BACT|nr:outer membrane beta-barrel protein [Dysgonomonas mossii]MBF0760780.1 outer membrane beta-barrel protein [Dysgonomonas mossii]TFU89745.1 porin family protein [Dysgonomonas mossii]